MERYIEDSSPPQKRLTYKWKLPMAGQFAPETKKSYFGKWFGTLSPLKHANIDTLQSVDMLQADWVELAPKPNPILNINL